MLAGKKVTRRVLVLSQYAQSRGGSIGLTHCKHLILLPTCIIEFGECSKKNMNDDFTLRRDFKPENVIALATARRRSFAFSISVKTTCFEANLIVRSLSGANQVGKIFFA